MSEQAALDLDVPRSHRARKKVPAAAYLSSGIVPAGDYRYRLWRIWDASLPRALVFMLNPSTATALKGTTEDNDPTIATLCGFATAWRCGGLEVGNAFGLKATNPVKLYEVKDPVGAENDRHLLDIVLRRPPPAGWIGTGEWTPGAPGGPVVVAWGNHAEYMGRDRAVLALLAGAGAVVQALGVNKNGTPWHPLRRAHSTPLVGYTLR